ncbi:MAG: radical SAM family heme chaperone HemW [Rikenellaceae bacterium]|jgi:oxygen-independent coproporphyrinogen-3 oxidase|nr:radical SAM family heme chaperone HemW [Rikenellaceae bacterium]
MAGLYIHIPFCGQRCGYCDFYKSTEVTALGDYVGAVVREMEHRRDFFASRRLDTIYIGGGTPSLVAPEVLQSLLDEAGRLWDTSGVKETTLEGNPEDLTDEYLARLADTGFNRLSIGVQSFDDGLLGMMNRRHSAERARQAVRTAERAGFGNITIDLIYGIPSMTQQQWERSLDEAIGLGVQHLSAYHLTIEPQTAFGRMAQGGKLVAIPEGESEQQYATLRQKLSAAGFEQYEISNFALPGYRAVHNSAYWSGEPYLGLGPSAHSYDGERVRSWVVGDVGRYLAEAGSEAIYEREILSDAELFNERVMTSLRRVEGLDTALLEQRFGAEKTSHLRHLAQRFLRTGDLVENGTNIAIPPDKFLLSDYIISELFTE